MLGRPARQRQDGLPEQLVGGVVREVRSDRERAVHALEYEAGFVDVHVDPVGRDREVQRGDVLWLRVLAELRAVAVAPLAAAASEPEAVSAREVARRQRPVGELRAPDFAKAVADRRGHRHVERPVRRLLRAASLGERVESVRRLGDAQRVDQILPVFRQEGEAVERIGRGRSAVLLQLVADVGLFAIQPHIRIRSREVFRQIDLRPEHGEPRRDLAIGVGRGRIGGGHGTASRIRPSRLLV